MKTVFDAIHGFIPISAFEHSWIKTPWFLRLQAVHQLGAAYRVFPGARHTRFEHSLGVMHLASKIFDHLHKHSFYFQQIDHPKKIEFYRSIIRLAALSHDLGHLPFSHTAEELVLINECHEAWTIRILQSEKVKEFLKPLIETGKLFGIDAHLLLIKVAVGEKKFQRYLKGESFSPLERILAEMITGDFFGADRMDYLLRDAKTAGLSYGFFDYEQLVLSLLIDEDPKTKLPTLMIDAKGIQACESMLTARYFMYQRLYLHPKVQAYGFSIKYLVKAVIDKMKALDSVENYLKVSDIEVLAFARTDDSSDEWIEKQKKAFFIDEDAYEVLTIGEEEKERLLNTPLVEKLHFLKVHDGSKFLAPWFYVKTALQQIKPFSACSKLVIPQVSEIFVLFERADLSNVLEKIQEVKPA
jgi:HD superfamily phosphohydrolase